MNEHQHTKQQNRLRTGAIAGVLGMGIGAAFVGTSMLSGPRAIAAERTGTGPAVIELFTSQGCYSCPPAEKLLGEMIKSDPDVIALEFHVDYWDSLVYGSHGSHKDPFSDPENTFRQQLYQHGDIQGRTGVYTPQMVVNGQFAVVGSEEAIVREGIEVLDRPTVELSVSHDPALDSSDGQTGLQIALGDYSDIPVNTHLWVAVFDIEKTTVISSGENHDKTLTSHNVVRDFDKLTPEGGIAALLSPTESDISMQHQVELKAGQGCAILLQHELLGTIHGASYCPKTIWKEPA